MTINKLHNASTDYASHKELNTLSKTGGPSTSVNNYKDARNNFFKRHENRELAEGNTIFLGQHIGKIHDDSIGKPTIGYGYNLSERSFAEISAYLTHEWSWKMK